MPVIKFEAFEKYPEFKGLFVGGCVDRGDGSSFRARAHAHCKPNKKDGTQWPNFGWICVRSMKRVFAESGAPSNLMLHELAHILTRQGHTDKFRLKLRELGGRCTLNAAKRKRQRWISANAHHKTISI